MTYDLCMLSKWAAKFPAVPDGMAEWNRTWDKAGGIHVGACKALDMLHLEVRDFIDAHQQKP